MKPDVKILMQTASRLRGPYSTTMYNQLIEFRKELREQMHFSERTQLYLFIKELLGE